MGVEIKEVNVPSLSDLTVNGMSHIQRVMGKSTSLRPVDDADQ